MSENRIAICVTSIAPVFDTHHFLVTIDDLIATQEEIGNCFIAHKCSAEINRDRLFS